MRWPMQEFVLGDDPPAFIASQERQDDASHSVCLMQSELFLTYFLPRKIRVYETAGVLPSPGFAAVYKASVLSFLSLLLLPLPSL